MKNTASEDRGAFEKLAVIFYLLKRALFLQTLATCEWSCAEITPDCRSDNETVPLVEQRWSFPTHQQDRLTWNCKRIFFIQ